MKIKTILMALFLTTGIAAPLMAMVREGAVTFSLSEGGYTFDSQQDVKTNVSSGVKLGYNLTANWGLESSFSYVEMESKRVQENDKGELYNLNGNILYHFLPENRFVPFFALGGGWSRTTHLFDPDHNDDGTFNYGAGVKYFVSDAVALRADFRNIYSYHDDADYWSNYEYTAGLSFQFGGTKAAPVAAVEAPVKTAMAPAEEAPKKQPAEPAVTPAKAAQPAVAEAPAQPVAAVPVETAPAVAVVAPVPKETLQAPPPAPAPVAEESACNKSMTVLDVIPLEDGVEIITDAPVDIFKSFELSAPTRMAIDICTGTHITYGGRTMTYTVNKMGITTVRVGNHPGKLRIAFDSPRARFPAHQIKKTKSGVKVMFKKKK